MPSAQHLLILALVILVLFGSKRLSEVGRGLGEGIKNFKKGIADPGEPERQPVRSTREDEPEATPRP
jgi:sec-independent protein translocase protein TatA